MDIVFTVFDERYVRSTGTLSARCAIAVDCRAWIRFCCEFDFATCAAAFDLRCGVGSSRRHDHGIAARPIRQPKAILFHSDLVR